jgi:hypothetical protein
MKGGPGSAVTMISWKGANCPPGPNTMAPTQTPGSRNSIIHDKIPLDIIALVVYYTKNNICKDNDGKK